MTTDILHRVQRIDHLIKIKGTGSAATLAKRLGVCEKSVYLLINLMRDFGAPIKFCNARKTFYYDIEGAFVISFRPAITHDQTLELQD
ncbi:hypothetical protein Cpin_3155 [Chitinophaga pinensis DSM 2588]|uniref:HTH domain-containing protein n=1 Tax=Chitinophaga pinensis (strain ATCC 43595 / DSM 2588 / LMG 13176 / NBRC 15968 / NCIMB 11800 / UQM 2034) TaxID=485918 RepID=A0A979GPL7_CHIPD|nr:hypothetical protein Cpin_3155 [Chitinophaga pinensis DSM 2588]